MNNIDRLTDACNNNSNSVAKLCNAIESLNRISVKQEEKIKELEKRIEDVEHNTRDHSGDYMPF